MNCRPSTWWSQAMLLLVIALIPATASALWHLRRPTWHVLQPGDVSLDDVLRWHPAPFWVDARSTPAYDAGHVPGALSLNEAEWEDVLPGLLATWSPGRRIVVYCDGRQCDASRHVADRLRRELGTEDVHVLTGGWQAWQQASHATGGQ